MILVNLLMTCLFFIVLPFALGQLWKTMLDDSVVFTYLIGFFTVLAIFEAVSIPMVLLKVAFHVQVIVYSVLLLALTVVVMWKKVRKIPKNPSERRQSVINYFKSYSKYEWIYFCGLAVIILGEVFFAAFYDIGGWRSDDATYVVLSTSMIHDDVAFWSDEITGETLGGIYAKYAFSGIYVFYAYAAVITGLGVSVIEHTVCNVLFLLMAYGAFYLMSKMLFPKDEDRENRIIFLIFVSVLYLFGMYSHYSLTFRLLGTIWQGKAFLAVVMIPFLLAICPVYLEKEFSWSRCGAMMIVSLASMSLTMGAILPMILIPGILTIVFAVQKKNFKCFVKLIPVEIFPLLIGGCYVLIK